MPNLEQIMELNTIPIGLPTNKPDKIPKFPKGEV